MSLQPDSHIEKRQVIQNLLFPVAFLCLLWIVRLLEYATGVSLTDYGLYPLRLSGLVGIITSPLIHSGFDHLISNSVPVLLLMFGVFYFYQKIAYPVFFLTYFITGLMVWLAGRESYHIGASGLIYGLAAFLFVSGVLRKYIPLMALSLLVSFLYGGIIWGVFPMLPHISWESHLMGFVAGIVLAIYYRRQGPQRKKYDWEYDFDVEENPISDDEKFSEISYSEDGIELRYFYIEKKAKKNK